MNFVLSYTLPPRKGAAFGKAAVSYPLSLLGHVAATATEVLAARSVGHDEAVRFAMSLTRKDTGTEWVHGATGIVFRVDPEDRAPNVCPCCGRLVNHGDHALAGSDDAYCLGCYTWDSGTTACLPENTAHANPWGTDTQGARWHMQVIFEDEEGNTSSDDRYALDAKEHEMWSDEDNARVAWPGLTPEQIISVEISPVSDDPDTKEHTQS